MAPELFEQLPDQPLTPEPEYMPGHDIVLLESNGRDTLQLPSCSEGTIFEIKATEQLLLSLPDCSGLTLNSTSFYICNTGHSSIMMTDGPQALLATQAIIKANTTRELILARIGHSFRAYML